MIAWFQRAFDRALERFIGGLFGDPEAVIVVRKDSRRLPEKDQMPLYDVAFLALISPEDKRVRTIPLSKTYRLDYGDRLHIVLDITAGVD